MKPDVFPAVQPDAAPSSVLDLLLFEGSPDCVKLLDAAGNILSMNRNGRAVMEIDDFCAVAGLPWETLWPRESRARVLAALQDARLGGTGHFKSFCATAKGNAKWWDVVVTPLPAAAGRVERFLSVSRDITAIHLANERISDGHKRFSKLLESSNEGIYGIDADNICTFINRAGASLLGYEPEELIGQDLYRKVHRRDADPTGPQADCKMAAALRTGSAIRVEDEVFFHKSGRAIAVSYAVAPITGDGPPEGAVVTFSDISERKAIERALVESQERLRLATDASNLGLWAWNPVTDELRWENERPCQLFALAPGSALVDAAAFMADCLHPDFVPLLRTALVRAVAQGDAFQFEVRLRARAGGAEWVDFSGRINRHADGRAEVLGAVADISERKRADVALHESRESLEKIIAQAATGVVQADLEGRLTLVNKKFCQMLGYAEAELIGRSVLSLTAAAFVEPTRQRVHQIAAGGAPFVIEKQYVCKDGSTLWATSSVSALRSHEGHFQGFVAIVVDVTERRDAVEKLRDADRRKDEFLAMLAHELRNPLAPISSAAEILTLPSFDEGRARRSGEVIRRQVRHMTGLVDDLLDVSRVTRGLVELNKQPEDIAHVLALAVEQAGPLLDKRRHRLTVQLPPQRAVVLGDNSRLVQVFANLLNNAAKYTQEGGEVVIAAQVESERVFVTITDNGAGIEQDLMGRIFDLFSQAHRTSDRASGGLGIGLALVKSLVELHGGKISCASAGPRLGSQFTVCLPLYDARKTAPADLGLLAGHQGGAASSLA